MTPNCVVRKIIKLPASGGRLRGFLLEGIKVEMPETLCKTIIGLSPEYLWGIPNVATASETRKAYGMASLNAERARQRLAPSVAKRN